MSDDKREVKIKEWREKLHSLIEEHSIKPYCDYNGNQTGLYYQKLPNHMYVDAKKIAGVK